MRVFSRMFRISFIVFSLPQAYSENVQAGSLGRDILDRFNKTQTEWTESYARPLKQKICGEINPDIDKKGLEFIQKISEQNGKKCYNTAGLPKGIGIDFSSYQNLSEEFFFDSLVRLKLQHLRCRQYAMNCLNQSQTQKNLANDFVDRLSAFQVYRDKFKDFNANPPRVQNFSDSEKKTLEQFFPGATENPQKFFSEWDPITALTSIVNYTNSKNSNVFLFQEAFASIAQDEKTLTKLKKMTRDQQLKAINELISKNRSDLKSMITQDQEYWTRSCRPEKASVEKDAADDESCFYRPTLVQKKRILSEFNIISSESNLGKTKNITKEERAFICALKMRYGEGAQLFDSKLNLGLSIVALIHPARAIAGALASRSLTSSMVVGLASKRSQLHPTLKTAGNIANLSSDYVNAMKMKLIYDKCTSKKQFDQKHTLTQATRQIQPKSRTPKEMIQDCKSCQSQPFLKQSFDRSCVKEAASWVLNKVPTFGIAQSAIGPFAMDHKGQTPISEGMGELTDTMSLFFYNLSLTSEMDMPSLEELSIFSENGE